LELGDTFFRRFKEPKFVKKISSINKMEQFRNCRDSP
jgi:hypothetical protein